jgi:hypothetical protein
VGAKKAIPAGLGRPGRWRGAGNAPRALNYIVDTIYIASGPPYVIKNDCIKHCQARRSPGGLNKAVLNDRVRAVRYFHHIDHNQIVKCDIQLNENVFNTIRIGDESIPASEFIPSCYRRVLHADPLMIDAKDNAPSQRRPLRMAYAQSFLKEEVGKMYRGELIIRGNPQIEPYDVVLLTDEATGLHGPFEVESITHLFNQEMGFVSVIKPRP